MRHRLDPLVGLLTLGLLGIVLTTVPGVVVAAGSLSAAGQARCTLAAPPPGSGGAPRAGSGPRAGADDHGRCLQATASGREEPDAVLPLPTGTARPDQPVDDDAEAGPATVIGQDLGTHRHGRAPPVGVW